MFLWVHLDQSKHPQAQIATPSEDDDSGWLAEIENRIYTRARELGVLISKGSWFAADSGPIQDLCFRLTFAAAPRDALEVGVQRFGKAIDGEFRPGSLAATP